MKGENSSRPKHKTIKGICVQKCRGIYLEELSSIVDTLNKIGYGANRISSNMAAIYKMAAIQERFYCNILLSFFLQGELPVYV